LTKKGGLKNASLKENVEESGEKGKRGKNEPGGGFSTNKKKPGDVLSQLGGEEGGSQKKGPGSFLGGEKEKVCSKKTGVPRFATVRKEKTFKKAEPRKTFGLVKKEKGPRKVRQKEEDHHTKKK